MKQVRTNVFETNSSSVHAVCISKKQIEAFKKSHSIKDFGFPIYQKIPLKFEYGEFYRDFKVFTSPQERAAFLLTAIYCDFYNEAEERDRSIKLLKEILDEYKIKYEILPFPEANYKDIGMELSLGLKCFLEKLLTDKEKLITYLLGDSFAVVGSDEDDAYFEFIRKPSSEPDFWGNYYSYNLQDDFEDYDVFEDS